MPTLDEALAAKTRAKRILRDLPGVNGVGITWDRQNRPCVRVNVEEGMKREDRRRIPNRILGVDVSVETVIIDRLELDL